MKTIKFSHEYEKLKALGSHDCATLLEVFEIKLQDLSPQLLIADTLYRENGELKEYKLPKTGNYLLLLFEGDNGMFTTIRSAFPSRKVEYYKSSVGEMFKVKVLTDQSTEDNN